MGFLDLFKQKKDNKNLNPLPSLKPIDDSNKDTPDMSLDSFPNKQDYNYPKSKPLELTSESKSQYSEQKNTYNPQNSGSIPKELPSFPEEKRMSEEKIGEKNLPRFENDNTIKDFVSNAQPSKPFVNKPNFEPKHNFESNFGLPSFESEDSFESRPLYKGEIESMDKPMHFKLHEGVRKPLFIKTDQYKDAKKSALAMKNKFAEVEDITYRMDNLKEDQDSQYSLFKKKIEDIQRKLIFIDKTMFEKGD